MRFINLAGRSPAKVWLKQAAKLSKQLDEAANQAERREIIEANKSFWKKLLPWMRKITKGKCWFSESKGACQYWEVEHYRPKGAARDLDGTVRNEGYDWLAFDWTNFRLSGGVTNRKKGFFFPLREGTHVGTFANKNIDDEDPILLDPTKEEDPPLLSFNKNGDVTPTSCMTDWQIERATQSIKRYKLQEHEEFVEGRRDVWAKCELEINRCRNFLRDQVAAPSATNRERIRTQVNKLRAMGSFFSEFSAVANDCLRSCPEPYFQKLASPP